MAPQNRKRRYTEAELAQDDPLSLLSKKFKSTREHRSASVLPPPAFWDCLSKVWLTPRALRELDRRTQPNSGFCTPVLAPNPTDQFSSRKNLQQFARHGGPNLADLRRYPEPTVKHTMSSRSSKGTKGSRSSKESSRSSSSKTTNPTSNPASGTSKKTTSSNAYDANFEQHLVNNRVNLNSRKSKSNDLNAVRQIQAQPRPSLSPSRFSEKRFDKFQEMNEDVITEGDVMREVIPTMCGQTDIPNRQDLIYTKLESITNNSTVRPQPDFYDGAWLGDIDKHVLADIDKQLIDRQAKEDPAKEPHSFIVPTKHVAAPVAPNFFLEAKVPKGGADVAKRQACLDGALGARAMHKLQSYAGGKPVYDNNVLSITSTYQDGLLKMYATHVTPTGPEGSPEYHMSQTGAYAVIGSRDQCVQGFTAFRNGRDWAQTKRNVLISAANERARSIYAEPPTPESPNYDDDVSDPYPVEDSQKSVNDTAATSFAYVAEKLDYGDVCEVADEEYEEEEIYAEEPAGPTSTTSAAPKKRANKEPERFTSKARCHSSRTTRGKHRSRK